MLYFRYYLKLVVQNMMYLELFIDKISLSPYCFGLGEGVNYTAVGNWTSTMTDEEYCQFYGNLSILYSVLNVVLMFIPH